MDWIKSIVVVLVIFLPFACENKRETQTSTNKELTVWADTIIYDVLISNPDSLNEWDTQKVKHVNQQKIVDDLFELVYSGKKKAYHYYSKKPLTLEDIKDIEADERFERNKVGKLQFTETWHYNEHNQLLSKKVHSILVAYELYDYNNELRGYKAAFYLKDF